MPLLCRAERNFRTDTDITERGGSEVSERALTPWQPDADDTWQGSALEDEALDSTWDQFAVNREKFGIQVCKWSLLKHKHIPHCVSS
jgi:PAB1-binding protein PBP1